MIQEWRVTAPSDVAWTPEDLAQIGRALASLRDALPGRYPQIMLDGVVVLPMDPARPPPTHF